MSASLLETLAERLVEGNAEALEALHELALARLDDEEEPPQGAELALCEALRFEGSALLEGALPASSRRRALARLQSLARALVEPS